MNAEKSAYDSKHHSKAAVEPVTTRMKQSRIQIGSMTLTLALVSTTDWTNWLIGPKSHSFFDAEEDEDEYVITQETAASGQQSKSQDRDCDCDSDDGDGLRLGFGLGPHFLL